MSEIYNKSTSLLYYIWFFTLGYSYGVEYKGFTRYILAVAIICFFIWLAIWAWDVQNTIREYKND